MDETIETVDGDPARPLPENAEQTHDAADATVDATLARLDDLSLADHPDVYQEIHAGLQRALADIDDA